MPVSLSKNKFDGFFYSADPKTDVDSRKKMLFKMLKMPLLFLAKLILFSAVDLLITKKVAAH